jgi:hypothetical protein
MLIKVFGKWTNPAKILGLTADDNGTTLHYGVNCIVRIEGKSPDEVAQEINRQIKESK